MWGRFIQFIRDLLQLKIDGYDFDPDSAPGNNNVIVFITSEGKWVYRRVSLYSQGGVSTMEDGDTLDMNGGDIQLSDGDTVDGVDISAEVMTITGGPDFSPVANAMLYWDTSGGTNRWNSGKSDLLNGGTTNLHYHSSDRNRSNHTGSQSWTTISDTPVFFGLLDGNLSTNGTTWVTFDWKSSTKRGFTHTDGDTEIVFDATGYYLIIFESTSNYNVDDEDQYLLVQKYDTSWSTIAGSGKINSTSAATYNGMTCTIGPVYIESGEKIKCMAKFSAADAGSVFINERCTVSIMGVK